MAQWLKNPPANARDAGLIPGWGRSPGEGSILAWEIPWTEEPGRLQPMGLRKGWTQLSDQTATACKKNVSITPFISHPMVKKLISTEYFFPEPPRVFKTTPRFWTGFLLVLDITFPWHMMNSIQSLLFYIISCLTLQQLQKLAFWLSFQQLIYFFASEYFLILSFQGPKLRMDWISLLDLYLIGKPNYSFGSYSSCQEPILTPVPLC